MIPRHRWPVSVLLLAATAPMAHPADLPEPAYRFSEALVIDNVRRAGRNPVRIDAIESLLVRGEFKKPSADSTIMTSGGTSRRWRHVDAREDGWINDSALRGGYAFSTFESPNDNVMLLDARGHSLVYVNGEPRTGDPYRYGATILPVPIHKGENTFLFLSSRGGISASLRPLPLSEDATQQQHVFFLERDDTFPDVIRQRPEDLQIAVVLVNALEESSTPRIVAIRNGSTAELQSVTLPPMSIRKVGLRIPAELLIPEEGADSVDFMLELEGGDSRTVRLPVKNASDKHRVTFRSTIDDSVQYYAVVPQTESDERPGLILSLHGAGVEAQRQASCYSPKDFAVLVAPTNRRSFGFDWEDWGRLDAIEVLEDASARFDTDPRRQWVTGHSMGGHGTWHLGAVFPDRFAAVAPSAGWVSFWSYADARSFDDLYPLEQVLRRAASGSDTLAIKDNYATSGVFILHGEKDDNVPVKEARTMRSELSSFHPDFTYYERPGAGHWWGDECMDWAPLIEFLRKRSLPDPGTLDTIRFMTASPGISPGFAWAEIRQQQRAMLPSTLTLDRDRGERTIRGTTENVAVLAFDLTGFEGDEPVTLKLDYTDLEVTAGETTGRVVIARDKDGDWHVAGETSSVQKSPSRGGPFKDAFRNGMIFVVGTAGTPAETRVLWSKARFDSEQWWYRGNGSVSIVEDTVFLSDHDWRNGRNVVLYGNAETNGAWDALVDDVVRVDRTGVSIGEKRIVGDDLAVLMVRPIEGDPTGAVAVVAGTGEVGTRLVRTMPYWVSGIGYPDLIVFGADMLDGNPHGVRAAGFFGNDWTIENGEIEYPEGSPP